MGRDTTEEVLHARGASLALFALRSRSAISLLAVSVAAAAKPNGHGDENKLRDIKHIVVIYEENHSFDNLYGGWEGVRGLSRRRRGAHDPARADGPVQLRAVPVPLPGRREPAGAVGRQSVGAAEHDLQQHDGRHVPEPLHERAVLDRRLHRADRRHLPAGPNGVQLPERAAQGRHQPVPNGQVVPGARSGGCTRDIVHRFYEEQFQLNGGQQNRYALQSDAAGLTMGTYDTKKLPVYRTCTAEPTRVRDPGQLLPGRVRRLVPEPPVADRSGDAGLQRGERLPGERDALRARPQRQPDARQPAGLEPAAGHGRRVHLARHRPEQRRADAVVRPADDAHVARLRRLQRQHAAAGRSSRRACSAPSCPAQTNPTIGDRMTAQEASTGPGTRAAGRTPTATSATPAGRTAPARRRRRPAAPTRTSTPASRTGRSARTTCSSTTTSRSTTTRPSRRRPPRGWRTGLLI